MINKLMNLVCESGHKFYSACPDNWVSEQLEDGTWYKTCTHPKCFGKGIKVVKL